MKSRLAAGAIFLTLAFQTSANAQETAKSSITPAQQAYANKPGNEFKMTFSSVAAPQGITIVIDPDDTMPVIDPRTGKFYVTPRFRFLEGINNNLPAVAGGPSPAQITKMMEANGSNTVDGKSVSSMFHHLVNDHKVPKEQIWKAIDRCAQARHAEGQFKDIPFQSLAK